MYEYIIYNIVHVVSVLIRVRGNILRYLPPFRYNSSVIILPPRDLTAPLIHRASSTKHRPSDVAYLSMFETFYTENEFLI